MARTKAVVFDCDGLLLDTEKLWTRGEKAIFAAYGREYTAEHRRLLFGTGVEDTGEILARVLDQPGREKELIEELKELTWDEVAKGARPMPGAAELVAELRGELPLGIASNSPAALVKEALERAGLDGVFQEIVGEEDVSRPKPDPEAYLLACERLGADPRASIALEDSPPGVAAARAAGLYVIGVPSESGVDLDADTVADSLDDPAVRRAITGTPAASDPRWSARRVEENGR